MRRAAKGIWMAAVIGVILNLMVLVSHGKAPNKLPPSTQQTDALKPPAAGKINVAFMISERADVMDIAGPWEVFGDSMLTTKGKPWHVSDGEDMVMLFNVYTVSDSLKPVNANGLTIVPNYSFDNAPKPQIIVIPAQHGRGAAQKAWLLANSATADVTMSVCTGAVGAGGVWDARRPNRYYASLLSAGHAEGISCCALRQWNPLRGSWQNRNCGRLDLGHRSGTPRRCEILRHRGGEATADLLEHHSELWKSPEYEQVKPVVASK